jgi:hypothetical protein
MIKIHIFEPEPEEEVYLGPFRGLQVIYTCHCGTTEIYNYTEVATASPIYSQKSCRACNAVVPQLKLLAPGIEKAWYRVGLHGVRAR